jgi:thiosulfate/3-mercaptopyruvate sulfurtransferase
MKRRNRRKPVKYLLNLALLGSSIILAGTAWAAEPLVDAAWVKDNIGKPGVVFIDFRPKAVYLRAHIPGAVHSQYGGPKSQWRITKDGVPGIVKDPAEIGSHLGSLGIDNTTHIVLVPNGKSSSDMGVGTRAYWTLQLLGHDEISILNGGMTSYLSAVDANKKPSNPLEKGLAKPDTKAFKVSLRSEMLLSADDVDAMSQKGIVMVDNRPADQYLGVNKHGKSKTFGTIPGALNMSQGWMTKSGSGSFRDGSVLKKLYAAQGVPVSGEQVSFCNTGHWASVGWFVSHEILGNKQAKMYDGSMTDWTIKGKMVEQKIKY